MKTFSSMQEYARSQEEFQKHLHWELQHFLFEYVTRKKYVSVCVLSRLKRIYFFEKYCNS